MPVSLSFGLRRLGRGEWMLAAGSLLLLGDLFGLRWFRFRPGSVGAAVARGHDVSASGWQSFTLIGPLTVVVCLGGIAVFLLTATRRSPALPVVLTTLLAPVSLALVLLMAVRVLLAHPRLGQVRAGGAGLAAPQPGAYIGLALAVAVFTGAYLALRRDGIAAQDAPATIETVGLRG